MKARMMDGPSGEFTGAWNRRYVINCAPTVFGTDGPHRGRPDHLREHYPAPPELFERSRTESRHQFRPAAVRGPSTDRRKIRPQV